MNLEISLKDSEDLIREVISGGGEFTLFPRGTSMRPLIKEGINSVVLTGIKKAPRVGEIPLYKRDDGQYVLHRIIKREKNGTYTMCGDNQTSLETGIRQDQMIAVVCAVCKGEKRKSVRSLSLRLYGFFWRSFLIRRIYFLLRRSLKKQKGDKK